MSDSTAALRQIADKAAAETKLALRPYGIVWVAGKPYRNSWVEPGRSIVVDYTSPPRCILCADTGILPKDDPAEPDQPCDCVRGGAA